MAAPDSPVLVSAMPYGSQVRLKWTRPAGTVSFKVYRDAVLQQTGVTPDHALVTVVPGTLYAFTVKATNGDGDSAASNTIQAAGPLLPLAQTESDIDVAAHEAASNPHPTYETSAEAQAKVDTHSADTTNVHGIADTSVVGIVQRAVVNLTDAQVKALPTTPVTLVAAPGAGKFIQPLHAVFRLIWTADYSNIDAACYIGVKLPGGELLLPLRQSVVSAVSGLLAGGGPDGSIAVSPAKFAAAGAYAASGFSGVSGFYDSDLENFPLTIYTSNGAAGDFTGGDAANVLRVTVYYVVVDL